MQKRPRATRHPPPASPAALLAWYVRNRRTMPWRGHPDPYAVWVSEIMLQQTRVDTVIPYFDRFMARFPSVQALATGDPQDVLRLWQGLGYYTRARHLHAAAHRVCERHAGRLPQTAAELRTLPGIGAYTAAAIASICFGEHTPVIDGNVLRVAARVLRVAADVRSPGALRRIAAWLQPLIDAAPEPGDFNQAMMELGALVCTPRAPLCTECPFAEDCGAFREGTPTDYPVRRAPTSIPERTAVGLVLWRRGKLLLAHRAGERFLGGLWELPGGFCEPDESTAEALARTLAPTRLVPLSPTLRGAVKHVYSHFRLTLHVFEASGGVGTLPRSGPARWRWVRPAELDELPLSKAPLAALKLVLPPPPAKTTLPARSLCTPASS